MNLRTWVARLSSLFQKTRLEQQLDEDVQQHLEMATEENLRLGMSPREAAESARRSFGGRDQMKEAYRDQRGIPAFETLARELRFAFRSLRRAPGFTALAMLTLALAIGANSAVFSAVNALLFHPPGVAGPASVVVLRARYTKLKIPNIVVSANDFKAVRDSHEIFASAAIARSSDFNYNGGPYPQRLSALLVSLRWFEVFGTKPLLGRVFHADEDRPRNNHVAILSFNAWQRLFAADPSIVEKTIQLDQRPYQIVGVMGPESTFGIDFLGGLASELPDLLVPLGLNENQDPRSANTETYLSLARLQPGVSFEKAQTFMSVLTDRQLQASPIGRILRENGRGLFAVRYTDYISGGMKTPMLILWGAVGLVLLIACSNIAGLMLARASARSRELAVRAALGGSRWHLVRQMLVESFLLAAGGALLGVAIANAFLRGVIVSQPDTLTALPIPFDLRVLLFTTLVSVLAAVLFGIAPALQQGRADLSGTLQESGRPVTAGPGRLRFRSLLVASEVALALVLSIGAGLLLRSLSRIQRIDTGFQPQNVMSARVVLPEARYRSEDHVIAFFRSAIDRLESIPGVRSAAVSYPLPFGGGYEGRAFQIVGRPVREGEPVPVAQSRLVTPEFFSTLRIPVQRGRIFTAADVIKTDHITVVDDALARQYWPGEDPLGQQIALQTGERATIVGIVGHIKQSDLAADVDKGVLYFSLYQYPVAFGAFVVQSSAPGATLTSAIREAINAVDPAQPIYDSKSMQDRVLATLAARRFTVALLGLFALTAIFLAALGLYGVINYGVTQRTQEIGIRMALGAQRAQVLTLIVGQGIRIAAIGLALGVIAAYALARQVPTQLFGVSAFDPPTFLGAAAALALVAIFASYIPARRATRLDPLEACRHD